MIALDSSALVAIAFGEPERKEFSQQIAEQEAVIGTPTLFETFVVLSTRMADPEEFLGRVLSLRHIHPVAFTLEMHYAAVEAYKRFGRGTGHPAKLNFGDCLSYAVAREHGVPLLYKGDDFGKTDIRPALP